MVCQTYSFEVCLWTEVAWNLNVCSSLPSASPPPSNKSPRIFIIIREIYSNFNLSELNSGSNSTTYRNAGDCDRWTKIEVEDIRKWLPSQEQHSLTRRVSQHCLHHDRIKRDLPREKLFKNESSQGISKNRRSAIGETYRTWLQSRLLSHDRGDSR